MSVGDVACVWSWCADRGCEDRRGENANAVGPEILQKPRHRSQDRGAQIFCLNRAA